MKFLKSLLSALVSSPGATADEPVQLRPSATRRGSRGKRERGVAGDLANHLDSLSTDDLDRYAETLVDDSLSAVDLGALLESTALERSALLLAVVETRIEQSAESCIHALNRLESRGAIVIKSTVQLDCQIFSHEVVVTVIDDRISQEQHIRAAGQGPSKALAKRAAHVALVMALFRMKAVDIEECAGNEH